MNKKNIALCIVTVAIMMFVLSTTTASAATFQVAEQNASITKTVHDDLYIAGNNVNVNSIVDGNAFVAGGNVGIDGEFGNLFVGTGQGSITANVENSAYIGCGTLSATIKTGRDLLIGCGNLNLSSESDIGQDLFVGAGNVDIAGKVGHDIKGGAQNIKINAQVGGNVKITAEQLSIGPDAVIEGNVEYESANKAKVAQGAVIQGKLTQKQPIGKGKTGINKIWSDVLGRLLGFITAFFTGLLLYYVWPQRVTKSAWGIMDEPWKTGGIGLLVLLATIPAMLIALFTIIGAPAALMVGNIYLWSLYLAQIFVGMFLGRAIVENWQPGANPIMHLFVGLLTITVLTAIPFVNIFVVFVYLIFGMGAIARGLYDSSRSQRIIPPVVIVPEPEP